MEKRILLLCLLIIINGVVLCLIPHLISLPLFVSELGLRYILSRDCTLVPIPKVLKDPSDSNNYRAIIALTSTLSIKCTPPFLILIPCNLVSKVVYQLQCVRV